MVSSENHIDCVWLKKGDRERDALLRKTLRYSSMIILYVRVCFFLIFYGRAYVDFLQLAGAGYFQFGSCKVMQKNI